MSWLLNKKATGSFIVNCSLDGKHEFLHAARQKIPFCLKTVSTIGLQAHGPRATAMFHNDPFLLADMQQYQQRCYTRSKPDWKISMKQKNWYYDHKANLDAGNMKVFLCGWDMNVPLFSGNIVVFKKPVARFFQRHIKRCELEIRQIAPQLRVVSCFLELAVRFRCVENQTVLRKRNDENWKHIAHALAQSNEPRNAPLWWTAKATIKLRKQQSFYGWQQTFACHVQIVDKFYII